MEEDRQMSAGGRGGGVGWGDTHENTQTEPQESAA